MQVFVLAIVISNLVCITLSYVAGTITGVMCIAKCSSQRQLKCALNKDVVQLHAITSTSPLYDEVDLQNKVSDIETNKNIAYETVKNS